MRHVLGTLILLFALISGVLAQLTITTPTNVVHCLSVQIAWSGGTAPYTLEIRLGNDASAAALETFSDLPSSPFVWNVIEPENTFVFVSVRDSTGVIASTTPFTIQPSGNFCQSTGKPDDSTSSSSSATETGNNDTESSTQSSDSGQPTNSESAKPSSKIGPIAGGAAGGVVIIVLLTAGIFFFVRHRRRQRAAARHYGDDSTRYQGSVHDASKAEKVIPVRPVGPNGHVLDMNSGVDVNNDRDPPVWTIPSSGSTSNLSSPSPPISTLNPKPPLIHSQSNSPLHTGLTIPQPTPTTQSTESGSFTVVSPSTLDPRSSTTSPGLVSPGPSEYLPAYSANPNPIIRPGIGSPPPLPLENPLSLYAGSVVPEISRQIPNNNNSNRQNIQNRWNVSNNEGYRERNGQVYQDIIGQFAAANRDVITPDLERKLRIARYLPTDNPGELSPEEWKNDYGVTYFELKRLQELYDRNHSRTVNEKAIFSAGQPWRP